MSDAKVVGDRDGNGFKLFDQSVLFSSSLQQRQVMVSVVTNSGLLWAVTALAALNIVNDRSDVTVDALWPQNIQRYRKYTARPQ